MSSINKDNKLIDKSYWRSSEDVQNTSEFQEKKTREFAVGASELTDDVSRRDFLKIMGASIAFAGVSGCAVRRPERHIKPYAKQPEDVIPGKPSYYATAMAVSEDVVGLLVESHEGRPTKIEGNPAHSQSLGKTGLFQQASVLDLYDPDRLKNVSNSQGVVSIMGAYSELRAKLELSKGERVAILTETQVSPTFHRLINRLQSDYPNMSVYRYDSVNRDNQTQGLHLVTSDWIVPQYDFSQADVIVSFESDFLGPELSSVKYAKAYASRREPELGHMNRLYMFESNYSTTGAKADHRFRIKRSDIEFVLWKVADKLFSNLKASIPTDISSQLSKAAKRFDGIEERVIDELVKDLLSSKSKSLLVAGPNQSETVHALVFLLNKLLGNEGASVHYFPLPFAEQSYVAKSSLESIETLAGRMKSQSIDALLIFGGDPAYDAPVDVNFSKLLKSIPLSVSVSSHANETTELSSYVVSRSHYLESWGDLMAVDGSVSIVQPLISPLYTSVSDIEVLLGLLSLKQSGYAAVRQTQKVGAASFSWDQWLHNGIVLNAAKSQSFSLRGSGFSSAIISQLKNKAVSEGLELSFVADNSLYDGRFSNNGWLQEVSDSITKLTWDNAAYMSPATARKSGLTKGSLIELSASGYRLKIAVYVLPGHADDSITLPLGYGRTTVGRIGSGTGFNAGALRTVDAFDSQTLATLIKLKGSYELASTQDHGSMEGRPLAREANLEHYEKHPDFPKHMVEHPPLKSLYDEVVYDKGYQWGMAIDLSKCSGCNVCLVACQSENNIPIVGKDQILNGREMSWIRIDRYFEGDENNPRIIDQPVTCLQCEQAPCEQVCPVAATTHSSEGLNDMTYNRCIGTRYCSDNCPAKVRRFNFLDYHQKNPQSVDKDRKHLFDYMKEPDKTVQMQFNPDVTVRMRGVMEKCTYCVQRIGSAKKLAENENRLLKDGEVVSACQQACPSDAIAFGNILDESSKVFKIKNRDRDYHVLEQLHLKARTSYLACIRNPNPVIEAWEMA
jgi:MoCo/4Fe-4S cofactor protein with predicted Tat translocation signal